MRKFIFLSALAAIFASSVSTAETANISITATIPGAASITTVENNLTLPDFDISGTPTDSEVDTAVGITAIKGTKYDLYITGDTALTNVTTGEQLQLKFYHSDGVTEWSDAPTSPAPYEANSTTEETYPIKVKIPALLQSIPNLSAGTYTGTATINLVY